MFRYIVKNNISRKSQERLIVWNGGNIIPYERKKRAIVFNMCHIIILIRVNIKQHIGQVNVGCHN